MTRLPYIPPQGSLAAEVEALRLALRELWIVLLETLEDGVRRTGLLK